jgi:predicted amidohydrolase YtcJ
VTDQLLLVNGRFRTQGDRPVEAVALVGERIAWAGTERSRVF